MALSQQLVNQTTRHQVHIERLKSGEVNQFAAFLKDMDKEIRQRLAGEILTDYSRTRLEKLLKQIEKALADIFDSYYDFLAGHLTDIAEYEAEFEAKSLNNVLEEPIVVAPIVSRVHAAINTQPLSVRGADGGKLLEPFIRDWTSNEIKRVSGAIRMGFVEGQTTEQILRTIRGTKANKYADGILAIIDRDARAIIHTAVQHVANTARQETHKANSDIVIGYRWISTLDARTTVQCRSLDQQVFKIGQGPLPPLHIRCRSTTISEIDPQYKIIDVKSTRASRNGQVDADLSYYEWLKDQPTEFQNDALGPTRAKLLREGGLSAERFAALNLGRDFQPLTLTEMRKLEPNAFIRAGL